MLEDFSKDDLVELCMELKQSLHISERQRSEERNRSRRLKTERDRLLTLIESSLGIPASYRGQTDIGLIEEQFLAFIRKLQPSQSVSATTGECSTDVWQDDQSGISSYMSFDSPYVPLIRTLDVSQDEEFQPAVEIAHNENRSIEDDDDASIAFNREFADFTRSADVHAVNLKVDLGLLENEGLEFIESPRKDEERTFKFSEGADSDDDEDFEFGFALYS